MFAKVTAVKTDIEIDSCPKIIEFENGNLSNKPDVTDKIQFDLQRYKFGNAKSHHNDILTADTGNMKYVGNQVNAPCRYYIGVLHKENDTLQIYNTTMFKMHPAITDEKNKTMIVNDEFDEEKSFLEKNDRLVEAFGSSKQKRAVSARKKNLIDKEEISGKILEVADNIDLSSKSLDSQDTQSQSLTPPINLLASSPAQLYNIEDIISPLDEPIIVEDADEFMSATREIIDAWKTESRFPEYIVQHLLHLPGSEEAKLDKIVKLRYLNYLIQFFKLTFADLRRKDILHSVPSQVRTGMFEKFSLEKNKKRFIPKRFKDKILCYILLLALIIDEFTLDCTTLMKDLKLGPARIGIHLKAIGCYIESKRFKKGSKDTSSEQKPTPTTLAVLKVPLPINFLQRKESL